MKVIKIEQRCLRLHPNNHKFFFHFSIYIGYTHNLLYGEYVINDTSEISNTLTLSEERFLDMLIQEVLKTIQTNMN
jgi:hypothetical protein